MTDKNIQKYNFKRPDRISKNQIRSLHFVHDRFARNFSSSLSAFLRTVVEVTLENIGQISYSEFMNTVSDPTCYVAISLKPLDGLAALEIAPALFFPMMDKLLVDNLKESWRQVYAIEFAVTTTETHPHMIQITAPNEMVIHFQFQVRMRETLAKMHLAIPTLNLEPIIHIFDQEEYSRRKVIHDGTLLQLLQSVPVKVSIETAETPFPMQSLLSLQVGDTIVLDQKEEWPAVIKVAGKSKLHAKAQMDSSRKTFGITGYIRPRTQEPTNGHVRG